MAKFQELFEYQDGDLAAVSGGAWVKQSGSTNWTYLVAGKQLRITHLTSGDSPIYWAYDLAGASSGDLDVIAKMVITDISKLANGSPIGPAIVDTSQNAAYALRYPQAGRWQIAYFVGVNAQANIGTPFDGMAIQSGVPFWLRIKRVAGVLRAMPWPDGDPMPESFPLSGTHAAITSARMGLAFVNYPPNPYIISAMGFASGADDAEPPTGGPQVTAIVGQRAGVLRVGEKGVLASVVGAGVTQGTGRLRICPSNNINDVNGYDQTVTGWSDTLVAFDVVRGTLPINATLYAFVQNDAGQANAAGFPLKILPPAAVLAYHALFD